MAHDENKKCPCVMDHNPNPMELNEHHIWPLYLGGPDTKDNLIWLCPTTHTNVHELIREWMKFKGEPPWYVRTKFSVFTRNLAQQGYDAWKSQG